MIFLALGLVLAVAGLAVFIRYQNEMRQVRARLSAIERQTLETACGKVEVAQAGSGTPVLVIHGNGGGVDQGLVLGQAYFGQGFRMIVPSRFGYLGSAIPQNASVELQANAYACLLDALGIDRAPVFATSAGVTSAVQFALLHPQRVSGLILHSPNAPGAVGLLPPPQAVFGAFLRSDFTYWAMSTYLGSQMQSLVGVPKGFALTSEMQTDVQATIQSVLPSSERASGMIFDTYIGNPAINAMPLEKVQAPTLVVSAVDDPMALHEGAKTLAARIPGARLVPVRDGGHMMLGHTPEVRGRIKEFLNQLAIR